MMADNRSHTEDWESHVPEGMVVYYLGLLRRVFLFKTSSHEEAQALAAADPAVRSGRLVVEIHPWMVPAGVLP